MLFIKLLILLSQLILFYFCKLFNKYDRWRESWLCVVVVWILTLICLSI